MKYVVTQRDKAILIALVGIVALAVSWFLIHNKYTELTDQLKQTNNAIQARVDVLQSIADQQSELVATTNSNNQEAERILAKFPSNVYEEDVILLAKGLQEFAPYELIESVGIGAPAELYRYEDINAQTNEVVNGYIPAQVTENSAPPAEGQPAEGQPAEGQPAEAPAAAPIMEELPVLYARNCTMTGETDYDGLKNTIRYIVDNTDRCKLQINAAYDITTGMLQSNVTVGKYYVTGTGKAYIEPDITNVIQGTDNIFGTVSLSESRPLGGAAVREGATEEETESE